MKRREKRWKKQVVLFQEKLNDVARILREAEKIVRDMLTRLDRMVALDIIGPLIEAHGK